MAAILFAMLTATASCQTFDLNEKMLDAAFALDEQQALIPDATEQRVQLTLTVKGINEEDYKVDYTIDGEPGSGSNSLTIYDTAPAKRDSIPSGKYICPLACIPTITKETFLQAVPQSFAGLIQAKTHAKALEERNFFLQSLKPAHIRLNIPSLIHTAKP